MHVGDAPTENCPVCNAKPSEFTKEKKGGLSDTNSNAYIITYSVVMVVVVAAMLALAAMGLQSRQEANILNEKKQAILSSLNAQGENYDDYIQAMVLDSKGQAVEGEDVFLLLNDLKGTFEAGKFPIFVAKDGRVVIPVIGAGLWGPVWGYVALKGDMNTIDGVVFDHKGETPGLGAEISTEKFQKQFFNPESPKQIFDQDNKFVSVKLIKGGAQKGNPHQVDGISGGTKTADGVSSMLENSLKHYLPFIEAKRTVEAPAQVSNSENVESNE